MRTGCYFHAWDESTETIPDLDDESIGNHVCGIVWYSVVHPQLCLLDCTTR